MNQTLRQDRHSRTKGWKFLILCAILLFSGLLLTSGESVAAPVVTPLQQSGLTTLWQENFTGGSIDRMQFTWSIGNNAALTSFVMPGAIYMGKEVARFR